MDVQVVDYLKKKEWALALEHYNQALQNKNNTEQQIITCLLDRSYCLCHLGHYEIVINDCKQILKSFNGKYNFVNEPRTRIQLIRSLFALNRHAEAELVIKEWLMTVKQLNEIGDLKITLENALERYFALSTRQSFELWLHNIEQNFSKAPIDTDMEKKQDTAFCIYCNISFKIKSDLTAHCLTQEHEAMIMSDEGHDWHWRAPPRGFKSDAYSICENWKELGTCRFGVQCVEAHGEPELLEWKERFQYREMKMARAKEKELYGKSYTEDLLEKWIQAKNSKTIMVDKVSGVEDDCSCPLNVTVSSKNSHHEWIFTVKTLRPLQAVALLQDTYRNHFHLSEISSNQQSHILKNNQEFISDHLSNDRLGPIVYTVVVVFQTTIFGTFRQSVVFDFGSEPVLVKHMCVDVAPDSDIEKINEIRKEITLSVAEKWTNGNSEIVAFSSNLVSTGNNDEWEAGLHAMYPYPEVDNFVISNTTMSEKKLTRNNYRERMHELLLMEEIARYNLIAQYNLTTKLQIAHSYILSPNSMAASTAKYSSDGELFASVCLTKELSEDTAEGRLILMHCKSVYLLPHPSENSPRKIYEALIEDKGKDMIYLRLSSETVRDLNLTTDTDLEVQIQFQLNRIPYCEWHYTIDKIRNYRLIFPDIYLEPNIPWSPSRQWSSSLDSRLNLKQKEAIVAITTPLFVRIPPILVIGPFGTGKTFTLAQAVRELIKDDHNKILLCTHSNSAADLYIKDYLDVWVGEGNESARPLRIYYQKRWVATVNPVVQKYCNIQQHGNTREFQPPTFADIERHKIVVVTLSTSVYLSAMGLPPGTFTHILLDEAAQALECETITPLALAADTTRIVLAGDHMQLGPDIFSRFAKERDMHISLLERLYDHYPPQFPCKILLCENYRAHESIIQFTSESFYDQKLVSSSKQPKHSKFYPLTFFTTRGEDVQDKNSTAFYNNSEVYEVVERVMELKRNWPNEWGDMTEQSIGVVTPYSDQVFRIRSELRKRKIDVCVERVLNVQGKQFRAIILSTVRTRRTCSNNKSEIDYGFLSNSKLLNTAITRAQSLVAVVGDPIALCSLGRCSKVWERFIQICKDNDSLYGITWSQLKFQLDGIELKKVYTLNPLAPEFVPRKFKEMMQERPPVVPKLLQPFQNIPNVRMVPLVYQQRPAITLPCPYVLGVPNVGPYRPLRVLNPHEIPVIASRQVPVALPPIPMQKHYTGTSGSTKLIQFMNNVHFPEAQMLNDCVSLLPQQMSLADMIAQPTSVHERWYNYLRDTSGQEAANKFKYLLHTIMNQKGSKVPDANILGRTTPQSSSNSPTFNWYDSPSNQINMNKPIYMTEMDNGINGSDFNRSNPLYKRQRTQPNHVNAVNLNDVNGMRESDVQRHINEDFANLSINNSSNSDDLYHVFKTLSVGKQNYTSQRIVGNSNGF